MALFSHQMEKAPTFIQNYFQAQNLVTCLKFSEAIPLLTESFQEISKTKNDYECQRVYVDVGGLLATCLESLGKTEDALEIYNKIFQYEPDNVFIGEFAIFCHRKLKDYERAECFYRKCLEKYPNFSSIHLKYAGFLRHIRKDLNAAEFHYLKSCESNPAHADALGSYASFLHGVLGNIDSAEMYYEKAIEADSFHTNNLCNFGLFLSEEKKTYPRAEELYRKALEVNPSHANTLYNFAVMLDTHCARKDEAESLYRQCIEVDPRHAFALYNLAVLLEDKSNRSSEADQNTNKEICTLLKRAVDCDTRDPVTLADYGRFLWTKMSEISLAEAVLQRALEFDPNSEVASFNLGLISQKHTGQSAEAEKHFRRLLTTNPNHFGGTLQMARLLVDRSVSSPQTSSLDEAFDLFGRAVSLNAERIPVLLEFAYVVMRHGNKAQKANFLPFAQGWISKIQNTSSEDSEDLSKLPSLLEVLSQLKSVL